MERVSLNLMSFLKNNQTLVIVPIYKNKFEDEELFSLEYSLNKLRQYEVFFFGPEDLDSLSIILNLTVNTISFVMKSSFTKNLILMNICFYYNLMQS